MKSDQTELTNTPAISGTPGLTQVMDAVKFTNVEVLQADARPMTGSSKIAAEQAAAMMVEDMRSYLQGSEQIIVMATAKALALLVNPPTQEKGEKALEAIAKLQKTLPEFATKVGTAAKDILTDFGIS